jgi:hypothetical protein
MSNTRALLLKAEGHLVFARNLNEQAAMNTARYGEWQMDYASAVAWHVAEADKLIEAASAGPERECC